MTRLTALIIQTNGDDIKADTGGEGDKWIGWIKLYKNGEYDRLLMSSEPIYKSREAAIDAMNELINKVRAIDLKSI